VGEFSIFLAYSMAARGLIGHCHIWPGLKSPTTCCAGYRLSDESMHSWQQSRDPEFSCSPYQLLPANITAITQKEVSTRPHRRTLIPKHAEEDLNTTARCRSIPTWDTKVLNGSENSILHDQWSKVLQKATLKRKGCVALYGQQELPFSQHTEEHF